MSVETSSIETSEETTEVHPSMENSTLPTETESVVTETAPSEPTAVPAEASTEKPTPSPQISATGQTDTKVGAPQNDPAPTKENIAVQLDETLPTPPEVQTPQYVSEDALFGEMVLFSTTENEPYASIKVESRVVTAPIDSIEFELQVVRATYKKDGVILSKKELKDIVHGYRYLALLSPHRFPIQTRCAMVGDAIYIDLGDAFGDRVKITHDGWIIEKGELAPPFFRRPGGMLPLPRPEKGGSIKKLAKFLNLHNRTEDDFKLLFGWLVDSLFPGGPYTMLVLNGPQGSAKSTTLRILRDLIDPAEAAMPSLPRSERDLFIAGAKMYLLSYDNVSKLNDKLSDAFCRIINHGTFRTRKLRTNLDEIIIKLRRPVIFNGISHFVRQNDFMDRAIFIELPTIHETKRRTEGRLLADWEIARPQILGALYNLVAVALRNLETVNLPNLPRMADSARWITAAESGGLWENGSFLEAYQGNRSGIVDLTLESDPVAVGVLNLMDEHSKWTGTSSSLLDELRRTTPEGMRKLKEFPKAANTLSNRIMRLEGFLATRGLEITRERKPQMRLLTLSRVAPAENAELLADAIVPLQEAEDQLDEDVEAEISADSEMEYGEV